MITLFGITTVVLYVVLFRTATRGSLRNSVRQKKISKVAAESQATPLTVVSDDAVITGERAWTALDDHQLERFLKDSSP
jgi:hypothetical protein